jgi:hypothetical protein
MRLLCAVFNFFYDIFLGCRHDRLTRIFTVQQETYRVCLDCGTHLAHSPVTLLPLSAREARRLKTARMGELKIMPVNSSASVPLVPPERKSTVA